MSSIKVDCNISFGGLIEVLAQIDLSSAMIREQKVAEFTDSTELGFKPWRGYV